MGHPMADDAATPVLDVLAVMTAASAEKTTYGADLALLLRLAALVAIDAAPASYLLQFDAGAEVGLTVEDAQQVLVILAPVVGTARIVSAASKISRAFGLALSIAELEDDL
jgi:hypothetical protein